jgi:hypothetical protein
MAEKSSGLIRSVTAHLRRYVKGGGSFLRHGKRYEAHLPFVVTLVGAGRRRARSLQDTLVGYTRDLSETGLTLLLPSVRVGDAYLTDAGSRLEVKLELPGGTVKIIATSVRFEQLSPKEAGCSYMVAASIIEMKKEEHERYLKYLKSGAGKGKRTQNEQKPQAATARKFQSSNAQLGALDSLTPASVNQAFEQFLRK